MAGPSSSSMITPAVAVGSSQRHTHFQSTEHKVFGKLDLDSSGSSSGLDKRIAHVAHLQQQASAISHISHTSSSSDPLRPPEPPDGVEEPERPLDPDGLEEEVTAVEEIDEDPRLATEGSQLHAMGQCKPCYFFQVRKDCSNGDSCRFCHYHVSGRRKRPGRRERAKLAVKVAAYDTAGGPASYSDAGTQGQAEPPAKQMMSL